MSQGRTDPEAAPALLPAPEGWAAALETVGRQGHAHLDLLDGEGCRHLLAACAGLSYRVARPLVGTAGREVRQDFELTMEIPQPHPLRALAVALEAAVGAAAAGLRPNPLPEGLVFNDLIVQRYHRGSRGITPHRDHLRYTGLVVLVTLVGSADFFVCADRSGAQAVSLPARPGRAILLAAPGFAGGRERPFHFVSAVREPRISLGIRQDSRPGEPT